MNGRKGLAEYADENLALFDGEDEVNQAEEVKQEDEQPHFEEERKLLDILCPPSPTIIEVNTRDR